MTYDSCEICGREIAELRWFARIMRRAAVADGQPDPGTVCPTCQCRRAIVLDQACFVRLRQESVLDEDIAARALPNGKVSAPT